MKIELWKYSFEGIPIRIELGPLDIEKNEFVAVRRDTGVKVMDKAILYFPSNTYDGAFCKNS